MNNNNRDSLIALLTQTQNVYQAISRKIRWSAADTERLPFKDMLFFFPEEGLPLLNDERILGMYVHIA